MFINLVGIMLVWVKGTKLNGAFDWLRSLLEVTPIETLVWR